MVAIENKRKLCLKMILLWLESLQVQQICKDRELVKIRRYNLHENLYEL